MQRRFGRRVEHDPQSRCFAVEVTAGFDPARAVYPDVEWRRYSPILDQEDLGCCTDAALVGAVGCEPFVAAAAQTSQLNMDLVKRMYEISTRLDSIPGQWPPTDTGSSGNAAAKAARKLGLIDSYSWAFTTSGLLHALQHGPVIIGIPWYERMSEPDEAGAVHVGGRVEGGHEVLVRGWRSGRLLCDNSWGEGWGLGGSFTMSLTVWEFLRRQQADVTIPHARTEPKS